jgi:hypothetical protein
MIIEEYVLRVKEKSKQNKTGYREVNKLYLKLTCDNCNKIHSRLKSHYIKMMKNEWFNKDYCNTCWQPLLSSRPGIKEKVTQGVRTAYATRGNEIKKKISEKLKGMNLGNNNGTKRPEIREKVSKTRSKLMEDKTFRSKFKQGSIDAWARGCYDNANTSGRANWHTYIHSNGTAYKVQGRYELKFIEYLDNNNLRFECHKGKIPYVADDGLTHHYFPDFYVYEWQSYVDPKATHWYRIQKRKFELMAEQHPDLNLRILLERDLKALGIKL